MDWWACRGAARRPTSAVASGRFVASPSRSQVCRPLYSTAVARWRNHAGHYAEVADLQEPFSEVFGYET
jgi:hypothetical protein